MNRSNTPLFSLLFIIIALVVGVNFSIPGYKNYTDLSGETRTLATQIDEKKATLDALQKEKAEIDENLVAQYAERFREDKVIGLLFDSGVPTAIGDISLADGGKTANGLSIGTVSLAPTFASDEALRQYVAWISRAEHKTAIASLSVKYEKSSSGRTLIHAPMTLSVFHVQ